MMLWSALFQIPFSDIFHLKFKFDFFKEYLFLGFWKLFGSPHPSPVRILLHNPDKVFYMGALLVVGR